MERIDAGVEDWLVARLGKPLAPPPQRRPGGPPTDSADMLLSRPPADAVDLSGLAIMIVYVDEYSGPSERIIKCSKAWTSSSGNILISAFCTLRQEPRTFRVDRIRDVINLNTGEIESGVEFFRSLGIEPNGTEHQRFMRSVRRGLKVIMSVASIDGLVYADEIEAVMRWAHRLAESMEIDISKVEEKAIHKAAVNMRPDAEVGLRAFREVAKHHNESLLLVRAIRDVMHADDHISTDEISLVNEIQRIARDASKPDFS